jgi:hypothetical protein
VKYISYPPLNNAASAIQQQRAYSFILTELSRSVEVQQSTYDFFCGKYDILEYINMFCYTHIGVPIKLNTVPKYGDLNVRNV